MKRCPFYSRLARDLAVSFLSPQRLHGEHCRFFFEICLKVARAFAVDLCVTRKTRGPESHSDAVRLKTESKGRLLRYYSSREQSSFGLGLFFDHRV
jgi:hypothetical protein